MKTLTLLLAAYVVMSGSHTYREVFIQFTDKTGAVRIECGNHMESCSDLAESLNMARDRREAKFFDGPADWMISFPVPTIVDPSNTIQLSPDSNIVNPVRPINCHKRCGSDEDCKTAPTVCE